MFNALTQKQLGVVLLVFGVFFLVWGIVELPTGHATSRGGTYFGIDATIINWLKVAGGVAFLFLAAFLWRSKNGRLL